MFSLFDAGIECHLKEDMCCRSSGVHRAAIKITGSDFRTPLIHSTWRTATERRIASRVRTKAAQVAQSRAW